MSRIRVYKMNFIMRSHMNFIIWAPWKFIWFIGWICELEWTCGEEKSIWSTIVPVHSLKFSTLNLAFWNGKGSHGKRHPSRSPNCRLDFSVIPQHLRISAQWTKFYEFYESKSGFPISSTKLLWITKIPTNPDEIVPKFLGTLQIGRASWRFAERIETHKKQNDCLINFPP